jgi:sporulation protein YlmC with PRC-barrel domain
MSAREVHLHYLVGRKVRDSQGRFVGRIHELCAEIEQHAHGNDYLVREFHLRSIGAMEFLGGSCFVRELLHTLHLLKTDRYVVPWDQLDLSDPAHPKLTIEKDRVATAPV